MDGKEFFMETSDLSGERRRRTAVLHAGFEVGIVLKGLNAVLEIVGGLVLEFVRPAAIGTFLGLLTQQELARNSRDLLASILLAADEHYSTSAQHFGAMYLLFHGWVKIVLALLLWRRLTWAYPLVVSALALFILFQTIRWASTHSVLLAAFTVLDAAMIWLTIVEYKRTRHVAF